MAERKNHNNELNMGDALTQSEAFLAKNKKAITGTVVTIIVIVVGVILYRNFYVEPREEEAQTILFKSKRYFEQSTYGQVLNGDSIGSIGFLKVVDQFSGAKVANLAKAYAGIRYQNLGKYDGATKALDGFNGNDQIVAPAIQGTIGSCYAQLDQLDKAASTLLKAADNTDNSTLSPISLLQAEEILMKQGKDDDAVKAFTKIKDKYFQSYQTMDTNEHTKQARLLKK